MKKIILGIVAIALTVGLVSGAAYAVFSDTVEVNGIAITAGNADLKIFDGEVFKDTLWGALSIDDVYPGWMDGEVFVLKNDSDSDIGLDVTAQLTERTGNWGLLNDQIEVAVLEFSTQAKAEADLNDGTPGVNKTPSHSTGWLKLYQWENNARTITGNSIPQGDDGYFVVWARVNENAGNEIADTNLNMVFELLGTQDL